MLKISVFNFKGGTGKSTTALNLGAALASKYKTLVIDLDGQRTLSFGLGLDGREPNSCQWLTEPNCSPIETSVKNLWAISGDIGMFRMSGDNQTFIKSLKALIPLDFKVVLMDCPPSLSFASVQALLNSDRVLIPTLCEPAALKGLSEAVELIRGERTNTAIEVVRTRYKPRLVLTREADDLLIESAEDLRYRLLHCTIPENVQVAESIAQQMPVTKYAPSSNGSIAYKSLAKELIKLWELK
jgi:chromosome partitioning protein